MSDNNTEPIVAPTIPHKDVPSNEDSIRDANKNEEVGEGGVPEQESEKKDENNVRVVPERKDENHERVEVVPERKDENHVRVEEVVLERKDENHERVEGVVLERKEENHERVEVVPGRKDENHARVEEVVPERKEENHARVEEVVPKVDVSEPGTAEERTALLDASSSPNPLASAQEVFPEAQEPEAKPHITSQEISTDPPTDSNATSGSSTSLSATTEPISSDASANDVSTSNADVSITTTTTSTSSSLPAKAGSPSNKPRSNTGKGSPAGNSGPPPFSLGGSTGIEEDSGSESDEISRRKGKRKERGYSKIILEHKKNLLGQTIFKGHPSWVLMLNIQTGIRNVVGKSMHQSRSFRTPTNLSPSHSQPQPSPPVQPTSLPTSSSTPITQPPVKTPPSTKTPPLMQFSNAEGVLGPEQFEKIEEFYASPRVLQFPSAGSAQTIPHETGPFKFKDYCPHAFRFLRHRFGIDQADYMVSLCNTQKNGENALRELPTPGKSGSLFFFSHDMRFILKTIPKSEAKLLRLLLPSYVQHIANDENTLLPKFFGLHRVKPHKGRQVRFVVMSNVFQTRKKIHERFDLKGSTLGRAASEDEKKKDTVTYKDLDFREKNMKIQIGPQRRDALLDQLKRDCKFLGQLNIMDYSLLIGIHYEDRENDRGPPSPLPPAIAAKLNGSNHQNSEYFHSIFQSNDGGMRGVGESGNFLGTYYYMGIIDILMLYSIRKKVEHTYKTLRFKKEGTEISSISPPDYATRFYEFVSASIV